MFALTLICLTRSRSHTAELSLSLEPTFTDLLTSTPRGRFDAAGSSPKPPARLFWSMERLPGGCWPLLVHFAWPVWPGGTSGHCLFDARRRDRQRGPDLHFASGGV